MNTTVISIANQKGGVGKTTTAFNIAAGLVKAGKKVLVIDFDPQGNLTDYLGCSHELQTPSINDLIYSVANNNPIDIMTAINTNAESIDYIPSSLALSSAEIYLVNAFCREQILKRTLQPLIDKSIYDYIVIDCMPSLGLLVVNALVATDKIIIPVQAQKFALDGLSTFLDAAKIIKETLNPKMDFSGLLLTMYDNTNMAKAVAKGAVDMYPEIKLFNSKISRSVEAANSTYEQRSLVIKDNSKLGEQYKSLVAEMLERTEEA